MPLFNLNSYSAIIEFCKDCLHKRMGNLSSANCPKCGCENVIPIHITKHSQFEDLRKKHTKLIRKLKVKRCLE